MARNGSFFDILKEKELIQVREERNEYKNLLVECRMEFEKIYEDVENHCIQSVCENEINKINELLDKYDLNKK